MSIGRLVYSFALCFAVYSCGQWNAIALLFELNNLSPIKSDFLQQDNQILTFINLFTDPRNKMQYFVIAQESLIILVARMVRDKHFRVSLIS